MATSKESVTLNEAQTSFLALLMRNIQTKPDIDFDAVAKELGINTKSAKERFRLLSIKMGWKDGPKTPSTPKKPTGVTKRTPGKVGTNSAKKGGKGKMQEPATPNGDDDSDELGKDEDFDKVAKDEFEA
ncbi:hypothetical protein J7T55_011969 [Diaporthe amygdali]|uniref:uncharacterized protein n=1 Tax=Phomopsis amygdali TaxID=1214568 RepID=UPI0022FF1BA9|nr:uncharacterized protein J7T55_011969 [Diaporthe amygdali]KAJ0123504.1 hypothetical protein J7T55_011969 [Diaporthe amygdali]